MNFRRTTQVFLYIAIGAESIGCGQGPSSTTSDGDAKDAALAAPTALDMENNHSDWVHVPGGRLVHPSCVHEVPNGAHVMKSGDVLLDGKLISHFEQCTHRPVILPRVEVPNRVPDRALVEAEPPSAASNDPVPATTGWALASWATSTTYFTYMLSGDGWVVPSAPTADRQTIYLFDSFESSDSDTLIVQPVLSWGQSLGAGWQIAAWGGWGTDSLNFVHGTPVSVTTNQVITGYMYILAATGSGSADQEWIVSVQGSTGSSAVTLEADDGNGWQKMTKAQGGVLEFNNVNGCADLPANGLTTFAPPQVYQATSTANSAWNTYSPVTPSWQNVNYLGLNGLGATCSLSALTTAANGTALWYLQQPPGCGQISAVSGLVSRGGPVESFSSCDGRFTLKMQNDGNLVLAEGSTPLWSTNTGGTTGYTAALQNDGNFVLFNTGNAAIWSTNTGGNPGAYLYLLNNGNLVLYSPTNGVVWASNTCCH